jgi:hypothetical protein
VWKWECENQAAPPTPTPCARPIARYGRSPERAFVDETRRSQLIASRSPSGIADASSLVPHSLSQAPRPPELGAGSKMGVLAHPLGPAWGKWPKKAKGPVPANRDEPFPPPPLVQRSNRRERPPPPSEPRPHHHNRPSVLSPCDPRASARGAVSARHKGSTDTAPGRSSARTARGIAFLHSVERIGGVRAHHIWLGGGFRTVRAGFPPTATFWRNVQLDALPGPPPLRGREITFPAQLSRVG